MAFGVYISQVLIANNSSRYVGEIFVNAELCGEETESATSDLLGNAWITLNNYSLNKFKSCCKMAHFIFVPLYP
jgi:hypothetical protein